VELMEVLSNGNVIVSFKGDLKTLYEYRSGREIRSHPIDGLKKIIKEFRNNYLVVVTFEKKN
jgi:hypothetical protein